jgi:osmotically-inducible protein OsmY
VVCSGQREDQSQNESEDIPQSGPLPPDLDGLDDEDLQEHLFQLVREDGQVDTDELQIVARRGVVYLEGAVPSDTEHDVLLSILTDVAGIREIVDHLEIQRLAWERSERSKDQSAQDIQPGAGSDQ